MRILCRKCGSDDHLLRVCNQMSSTQRIRFSSVLLLADSVCSDSDECNRALGIAQKCDDASWRELENSISRTPENCISESSRTDYVTDEVNDDQTYVALVDSSFPHRINHSVTL